MAAAASAVRSVLRSGSIRNTAARFASQAKAVPSPLRVGSKKRLPLLSFRSPVELSFCVESMLPFHSASASALMTSMLSISCPNYGRLSEDY